MKITKQIRFNINRLLAGVTMTTLLVAGGASTVSADNGRADFVEQAVASECQAMESMDYVKNQAIVCFHSSTGKERLAREGKVLLYDVTVEEVADFGDFYVSTISSESMSAEELIEWAYGRGYVELASADASLSVNGLSQETDSESAELDPLSSGQWGLNGSDRETVAGMSNGIGLTRPKTSPLSTPVVAVIDTGIDYTHEDLADAMWINPLPDELAGTYGYDFADSDSDPIDTYGHGTHVAGIIASSINNGKGIEGIADAKLMAVKVCKDKSDRVQIGKIAMCYSYIHRCMSKGVNVVAVNCSWGGTLIESNSDGSRSYYGAIVNEMIRYVGEAGALTVFAAGNDGADVNETIEKFEKSSIPPWDAGKYRDEQEYRDTMLPAPFNLMSDYLIIVGASNVDNQPAFFSNYSSRAVDLLAPGSMILSTWIENRYMPQFYDEQKKAATTMYYNTFSQSDDNILPNNSMKVYTASELGLTTVRKYDNGVYSRMSGKTEIVTDDKGDSFIKFTTVADSQVSTSDYGCNHIGHDLYIDVTNLNLDTTKKYHISYMTCFTPNNEPLDKLEWSARDEEKITTEDSFVTVNGRTYLSIILATGPLTAYVDDIAVSYADLPDSAFGKYFISSGTSMAAPAVSGAIAFLKSYMPECSAIEIKDIVLQNVAKADELTSYCSTSGILNMSAYPEIIRAYCKERGIEFLMPGEEPEIKVEEKPGDNADTEGDNTSIKGKLVIDTKSSVINFYNKKTLKLNALLDSKKLGKNKVTWKSANTKYATISKSGKVTAKKAGIGHKVKIVLKTNDGKKTSIKIKIKK